MLSALDTLTGSNEQDPAHRALYLAAWYHDAVYNGVPSDERDSAALAAAQLPGAGLEHAEVGEVVRLVELTIEHRPDSGDAAGQLLCDADLEVLGREAGAYRRYALSVRREYAHVPDPAFAAGRAAILRKLLEADSLYSSPLARSLWETRARANLAAELELLERPEPA